MKITGEQINNDTIKYPYHGKSEKGNIVLFFSEGIGVYVVTADPEKWKVGKLYKDILESCFTPIPYKTTFEG